MKKQLLRGMGVLLLMGGLLTTCFSGCQQAQPEPEPNATITTKVNQTSTTTIESVQTTTTTTTDPLGYVDLIDSEDWPCREFNSLEGFIHWIENPDFKVEETPFEQEKDEHGNEVYKPNYFDCMFRGYQQMFAVDRFYMLPDVPLDWEAVNVYVTNYEVGFAYQDKENNKYHFVYVYDEKIEKTIIENSSDTIFKRNINNQEYYISDFLSELFPEKEKKGWIIKTFINGYLCKFSEKTHNPNEKDSATKGYEDVIYSEDTDLTDAVSKIKFKRIDLPPLK